MIVRLMRLVFLVAITSVSVSCKAEDESQESQSQRQRAQYQATQGARVLTGTKDLIVTRDRENGVTCWSRWGFDNSLSCLPDWMLKSQEKAQ